MKNILKDQLNSCISEREQVLKKMQMLSAEYEEWRDRVLELNGSIQTIQTTLTQLEATQNDTEGEATQRADSDEV